MLASLPRVPSRILASSLFAPILREMPREADCISHKLMLRAGFIRQSAAGIYSLLPLAIRSFDKVCYLAPPLSCSLDPRRNSELTPSTVLARRRSRPSLMMRCYTLVASGWRSLCLLHPHYGRKQGDGKRETVSLCDCGIAVVCYL